MQKKIKLPITQPPITSHQFYALPLAVICANKSSVNWVYSEFIQLVTDREREEEYTSIRFYKNKNEQFIYEPLENISMQSSRFLVKGNNISDIYKNLLDNGHYIYDFVDKYYIKHLNIKGHFIHDLLIYGYDDEKNIFNVFVYNGLKLAEIEVPYDEYTAAYNSEYKISRLNLTILYRRKEEEYKPDLRKIKWYLLDYMNGINTYNRENLHEVKLYKPQFGLNIYDELIYMFNFLYDLKMQTRRADLYCFYEHKKLMAERIDYLCNNSELSCSGNLLNEFKNIEAECLKVVMLSIKIDQKNFDNQNEFDRLIEHIISIQEKEKRVYDKYYNLNKDIFNNL
jgi:hypothetical protein